MAELLVERGDPARFGEATALLEAADLPARLGFLGIERGALSSHAWSRDGERFVHATPDATPFVRELFAQYGDEVADLEVRRASLEDTYMAIVHRHERAHLEEVSAR